MMTSSNGNNFRVTGHLCGEFTGPRYEVDIIDIFFWNMTSTKCIPNLTWLMEIVCHHLFSKELDAPTECRAWVTNYIKLYSPVCNNHTAVDILKCRYFKFLKAIFQLSFDFLHLMATGKAAVIFNHETHGVSFFSILWGNKLNWS